MPRPLRVFTNAITRVMSSPGAGAPRDVEAATAGIVRRGRVTLKKYLTGYFACAYRDTFETRLDGVINRHPEDTMTTLTKSATPTGIPAAVLPRLIDEGHGPNPWYGADVQSAVEDVDAALAARRPHRAGTTSLRSPCTMRSGSTRFAAACSAALSGPLRCPAKIGSCGKAAPGPRGTT